MKSYIKYLETWRYRIYSFIEVLTYKIVLICYSQVCFTCFRYVIFRLTLILTLLMTLCSEWSKFGSNTLTLGEIVRTASHWSHCVLNDPVLDQISWSREIVRTFSNTTEQNEVLLFYWSNVCFNMLPKCRISVYFSINTVDYMTFKMIHFWIKYL